MERSKEFDVVERPKHYNSHPSGLEAIDICEHLTFNLGNAVKYLWRAGLKNDEVEDLKKALWYVERQINQLVLNSKMQSEERRFQRGSELLLRVLMAKVAAADTGVLGKLFRTDGLKEWKEILVAEIATREARKE
jgi:hypothetical protein